ncbi:D-tyrosyl-tRNA deacylase [Ligilactobacillus hayakitensis DSM 18933 = JCM 14209]|uniref:D-aminoacyl-tRNA deacylase n=1 Tax=Ligilactobacillus hayakitensis DSM 18933 = JCM 14209 TaxID=1423755 RepID=A0A0R1WMK2_9LACO|nr:D-aminoacyl-tRNA deacylase [Ligilactobacillus hayakitensis]KRM19022.1 D-tyrosyl-tRNA deacylase [Ligilactobacillus hayakitensis DSM 18933 = JCM 14209]
MRVLVQRVNNANVKVEGEILGQIKEGLLLFVGFKEGDGIEEIQYMVRKILNARIFSDEDGKMNLNVSQVKGKILSISQFTLYAKTKKGNRPSFSEAQNPAEANQNYELFNDELRKNNIEVQTGEFGADMKVELVNDGPVTIMYDTDEA